MNKFQVFQNQLVSLALAMTCLMALVALAPGCGRAPDHAATVVVDAQASDYVARFADAAASHGRSVQVTDLVVQFDQSESQAASARAQSAPAARDESTPGAERGECVVAQGQTPVITLSRAAWDASSDAEREELMFHELGHCLLGLAHVGGINSQGIPSSLMNPTEIDGAIYSQFRDYYVNGLFAAK